MKKPVSHNLFLNHYLFVHHYFFKVLISLLLAPMFVMPGLASETSTPLMLKSVAGKDKPINFQDYAGKVILIDYWASWCGPCRLSFPWMNDMQAKYSDQGFEIIAINLDSDAEAAHEFLAEVPANFTLGFDPEGISAEQMQVEAMPMSYLIDRDGQIRYRLMGFNTDKKAEHESHIQHLVNETRIK